LGLKKWAACHKSGAGEDFSGRVGAKHAASPRSRAARAGPIHLGARGGCWVCFARTIAAGSTSSWFTPQTPPGLTWGRTPAQDRRCWAAVRPCHHRARPLAVGFDFRLGFPQWEACGGDIASGTVLHGVGLRRLPPHPGLCAGRGLDGGFFPAGDLATEGEAGRGSWGVDETWWRKEGKARAEPAARRRGEPRCPSSGNPRPHTPLPASCARGRCLRQCP